MKIFSMEIFSSEIRKYRQVRIVGLHREELGGNSINWQETRQNRLIYGERTNQNSKLPF